MSANARIYDCIAGKNLLDELVGLDRDKKRLDLLIKEIIRKRGNLKSLDFNEFVDLSNLDFSGLDCSKGHFFCNEMDKIIFKGANLKEVKFHYVKARNGCFDGAKMTGVNCDSGKFQGASFIGVVGHEISFGMMDGDDGVNLRGANFTEATLEFSVFKYTILQGAKFIGVVMPESHLSNVRAFGADFSGADLRGSDLSDGDFRNANFDYADLRNTDTEDADFTGASFKNTKF